MFCVSGCSCNESLVHNDVFTAEFVIGETVYSKKDYGINSKLKKYCRKSVPDTFLKAGIWIKITP